MTWNFHGDDSAKGIYDIILGRYLSAKVSDHVIEADDGTFKGSAPPMVDICMYEFKALNTGKITSEDFFTMLT